MVVVVVAVVISSIVIFVRCSAPQSTNPVVWMKHAPCSQGEHRFELRLRVMMNHFVDWECRSSKSNLNIANHIHSLALSLSYFFCWLTSFPPSYSFIHSLTRFSIKCLTIRDSQPWN